MTRLHGQVSGLQSNYDESTCVVVAESGCIVGDPFPDIRGLLHIKNEIEQKLFSKQHERQNVIMLLWSAQSPNIEEQLDSLNKLAFELKEEGSKSRVYAVNTDKIFLYNEDMQRMLVDKINVTFLRDSQFSNINNIFATRFLRNVSGLG